MAHHLLLGAYQAGGPKRKKEISPWLKGCERLIAVDGGSRSCWSAGRRPDLYVGDGDSVSLADQRKLRQEKVPEIRLRPNKDRSDLYHALLASAALGAKKVVCLGVTGGRPDHHLASLLELSEAARSGIFLEISAHDAQGDYYFLGPRKKIVLPTFPGQTVSVFSPGGTSRGVVLKGLKYNCPPPGISLAPGSRGLSNLAHLRQVEISLRSGSIVVFGLKSSTQLRNSTYGN